MAKKIAFVPFKDKEIIDMTQGLIDDFHRTTRFARVFRDQFDVRIRVYSAHWPVLADISTGVQIYIFGHGSPCSPTIDGGEATNSLTMPELAAVLKNSGLNKGHKMLKLHACHGGEGGTGSMAYNLWKAMRDIENYHAIKVCGYAKALGGWVDKKGNKVGVDPIYDDDGDLVDVANETRQKDLRTCWP